MSAPRALSQHPDDRLIRELIATGRDTSPAEVARIIERMATAPFLNSVKSIRVRERGISYQGKTLGRSADSLTYHLVKRVMIDAQWVFGTTAAEYLADLHTAMQRHETRLAIFERQGGSIAATVTPTAVALPRERQGKKGLPFLLVIYSADQGMIVTGYQFSGYAEISIPEEARWLK